MSAYLALTHATIFVYTFDSVVRSAWSVPPLIRGDTVNSDR